MARSPKRNPWDLYAAVRELVDEAKAGKLPEQILLDDYAIAAEGEGYHELSQKLSLAKAATRPEQVVDTLTSRYDVTPLLDAIVALQDLSSESRDALARKIYDLAEMILDDDKRRALWEVADDLVEDGPERALSNLFSDIDEAGSSHRRFSFERLQEALQEAFGTTPRRQRFANSHDGIDYEEYAIYRRGHRPLEDQDVDHPGTWINGLRMGEGSYETSLVWRANEQAFKEIINGIPFLSHDDFAWHMSGAMVGFRVSSIPDLHQMPPEERLTITNWQPTFMFAVMHYFARRLENYPLLDDELHSQLEMEATEENVREAAERFVREGAPETWLGDLLHWFWDNDQSAVESDDSGGYPSDEQVIDGLRALGYLDEEEAEAHERRSRR